MTERRILTRAPEIDAEPQGVTIGVFRPKDPKDRGPLEFACPQCRQVLLDEMSEAYAAIAPPVYCMKCEIWLSPGTASK